MAGADAERGRDDGGGGVPRGRLTLRHGAAAQVLRQVRVDGQRDAVQLLLVGTL